MSTTISTHVTANQLRRYSEDYHKQTSYIYQREVRDAITSLWNKVCYKRDDPYSVAFLEVMIYLSKAYSDGCTDEEISEWIYEEVETIFNEHDEDFSTDIPHFFHLLCCCLFDYLVEEEGIDELNQYCISFATITIDRVDITFT